MRKLFLTLTIGVFALTLAACSNNTKTLKVDRADQLVVGLECAYAPYNWTTSEPTLTSVKIADGQAYCDGYDVKMARLIAISLDKELVIKSLDWNGLIPALQSEQIDAIIAGMSPTSKRKLTIDFTDAYYRSAEESQQTVVVLANGSYKDATSILDFSGADIAAQLGTLQDEEGLIEQMTGATHATALDDYSNLAAALEAGTIDGFIAEHPVATQIANNNTNLKVITFTAGNGFDLNEAFTTTAIGVRKADTDLRDAINVVLAGITEEQRSAWMQDFIERSSNNE